MSESGSQNLDSHSAKPEGLVHRFLRLFTVVRPGEAPTATLMALNVFLVLMAYYMLKPLREAFFLGTFSAAHKRYVAVAQAFLLILVVKGFCLIASKVARHKLIKWVTLFFISNLALFYIILVSGVLGDLFGPDLAPKILGISFYIWVGVFNVTVIAQFWAFANDIYTQEEGKRLFPLVAFGATFGAFVGAKLTNKFLDFMTPAQIILGAAIALVVFIVITLVIHRREAGRSQRIPPVQQIDPAPAPVSAEKPLEKGGGFRLIFKNSYLLGIALFVLVLNFVNTNGEYILDTLVQVRADQAVELGQITKEGVEVFLGKFYSDYMAIFNFLALFLQLFVVSRIFKWLGIRVAVFFLPVIALAGYSSIALGASLMLVKWVKAAENGTDYSLMNTTRHALFLVTSREEKYKAKAAVDTFFHRFGDVLQAFLVLLGTTALTLSVENFSQINVAVILIWVAIGVFISRRYKKLSAIEKP